MNYLSRRSHWVALIGVGLLIVSSVAQAATIRLKAVGVNGGAITPTNSIDVGPGDLVEVDITVSGWGTEITTVKTLQVTTLNSGMLDIDLLPDPPPLSCGSIKPLNFDTPDLRSSGAFASTDPNRGVCVGGSDVGNNCVSAGANCAAKACVGGVANGQDCINIGDCPGGECLEGECIEGACLGGRNAGLACELPENQCTGGTCESRPDWIFDGFFNVIAAVDTFAVFPEYRYGGTLLLDNGPADASACAGGSNSGQPCDGDVDCPGGTCNVVEKYIGTALLEVQGDANGSFTYDISPFPSSFVSDPARNEATLNVETLAINVTNPEGCPDVGACCFDFGDCQEAISSVACSAGGGVFGGSNSTCAGSPDLCVCPNIVSSIPADCENDARYPHAPTDLPSCIPCRIGFDTVDVTLSPGTAMDLIGPESFQLRFAGGGVFNPPVPESVELLGGTSVRVNMDKTFPVLRWSCLGLVCQGNEAFDVCWGHLPADVNNGGAANASDVLEIIDFLNGLVPLESYQCDTDNSGACTASDVLGVIDLLNGAGNFQEWNNVSQPVGCPTLP